MLTLHVDNIVSPTEPWEAKVAGARQSLTTLGNSSPRRSTMVWQRMVRHVMVGAAAGIQAMPRPAALGLGTGLGNLACVVARRKRERAIANLHLAFGDALSSQERETLSRKVFQHFGRSLVEFLRAPVLTPNQLSEMVTCEGWEHVRAAQEAGKGVIFVSAHLGNWEIMGRWLALVQQVRMTVVAKDPKNAAFAAYLRQMRENAGFSVLSKGESARDLLRVLRKGEAIFLMPDQNSGDVFVPFFGIPCGTVAGPASLALHTGAALIPIYCVAENRGYHVICLPQINISDASGDKRTVSCLMTELNAVLENMVCRYPDQWLWIHNRWKSAFEEKNHAQAWQNTTGFDMARYRWAGTPQTGD